MDFDKNDTHSAPIDWSPPDACCTASEMAALEAIRNFHTDYLRHGDAEPRTVNTCQHLRLALISQNMRDEEKDDDDEQHTDKKEGEEEEENALVAELQARVKSLQIEKEHVLKRFTLLEQKYKQVVKEKARQSETEIDPATTSTSVAEPTLPENWYVRSMMKERSDTWSSLAFWN